MFIHATGGTLPRAYRLKQRNPAYSGEDTLKSFLGLLNFYAKFLPNLSTVLAPLYSLLQKNRPWLWGPEQQHAFQRAKQLLTSASLLVHYNDSYELLLAADASPYGVGAVLSHRMPDGTDQPVEYASRLLSPAKRRYSQLDKEALSIIFGVTKFRQYLLGRHHFVILSDHKPLSYLFAADKSIPAMASARIQRWSLLLRAYDYSISHRPGKQHANTDTSAGYRWPLHPPKTNHPGTQFYSSSAYKSHRSAFQTYAAEWTEIPFWPRYEHLYYKGGLCI